MGAPAFRLEDKRVFVAGHRGMVGSAIAGRLRERGCTILAAPWPGVDLRRQEETERWMQEQAPDAVVLPAARVGGILANDSRPAEFLYDNLAIASAVIESARRVGVAKLLFLGSSCIYPRAAPQPIAEEVLLAGPLEPTNEWYAIAKIAGIKLCQAYRRQYGCNFISAMPCNLYGPGDNFDLESSHVMPALMRKMHEAKAAGRAEVVVWGTGAPRRELLHVDDLAAATVHLLEHYAGERPVNVGSGREISIAALAGELGSVTGFAGRVRFDRTRPDGVPRKLLDSSRLRALGWQPDIDLQSGLRCTYRWFLTHVSGKSAGAAADG